MVDVIVTGGRNYADRDCVYRTLNQFDIGLLIHGDCSGADTLASQWAKIHCVEQIRMPADWSRHGRGAGPLRNRAMLDAYPNAIVIAFPGGNGTRNCIDEALVRGRLVLEVKQLMKRKPTPTKDGER